MNILDEKDSCCGCQACFNVCPVHAIGMRIDEEGFFYPEIDDNKCINCDSCREACPILVPPPKNSLTGVFAGYAKDRQERMSSSSGGVFSVFARSVLREGGAVCGAVYSEDLSARHILTENTSDLFRIKGTKYVQSEINWSFRDIRERLEHGQTVLFSGTPCQVAGLKSFLGREYDSLLCIDLICHGVPAPVVWRRYLDEIANGKAISGAAFRVKKTASKESYVRFEFNDGSTVEEKQSDNLYMKGFLHNYYVRRSCFSCHFKGKDRCSDITIGDFWSIKESHPGFADENGNSAILVHTSKGQQLLNAAKESLKLEKAASTEVMLWNECLTESVARTMKRDLFYQRWNKDPLCSIIEDLGEEESFETMKKANIITKVVRKLGFRQKDSL